jgi:hypothetical protein
VAEIPVEDNSWWGKFRDGLAIRILNFTIKRIATPWYGGMLTGLITYGMAAAQKDMSNG